MEEDRDRFATTGVSVLRDASHDAREDKGGADEEKKPESEAEQHLSGRDVEGAPASSLLLDHEHSKQEHHGQNSKDQGA